MSESSRPSVAVVGTGAVGCFFAAYLLEAGRAEVTLCARTPFKQLEVRSERWDETLRTEPRVLTDPTDVTPVDWILLATKANQTAGAAGWLHALAHDRSVVVVLQNGVEHVERTRPYAAPTTRILPAVVYVGAEILEPGQAVHRTNGFFSVPNGDEAEGVTSEEVQRLAGLYASERRFVRPTGDIVTAAWEKLCGNVAANGITALTSRRMDVLRAQRIQSLLPGLLAEATAVARAEGARLPDDFAARTAERVSGFPDASGTSMLYDRLAGRPMEEDALYGAVVRAGSRHGIATPIHTTMLALLAAISARP